MCVGLPVWVHIDCLQSGLAACDGRACQLQALGVLLFMVLAAVTAVQGTAAYHVVLNDCCIMVCCIVDVTCILSLLLVHSHHGGPVRLASAGNDMVDQPELHC